MQQYYQSAIVNDTLLPEEHGVQVKEVMCNKTGQNGAIAIMQNGKLDRLGKVD